MDKKDIQNIIVFLSRTNLVGSEAMTMVDLLTKLQAQLEEIEGKKKL